MLDFCPKGSRIYVVTFLSIFLTAMLVTIDIFIDKNIKGTTEYTYQFKDSKNQSIKNEYFIASMLLTVISMIYMIYVCGVVYFEETWETTGLGSMLEYKYIIEGGADFNPEKLKSYDKDVPCYKRKSYKTCDIYPNTRKCKWDRNEKKCARTYTGGYSNFIIFVGISIFLIIFGTMILKEEDKLKTSNDFETLGIVSIISGSVGLLFSIVDLFVC